MADFDKNNKRRDGYIEAPENRPQGWTPQDHMREQRELREQRQQNRRDQDSRNPQNQDPNNGPKRPGKFLRDYATAALFCGIFGLLNLCGFAFTTAIIFGVGAICFAYLSKKDGKLQKKARIAIYLGVAAILAGAVEYVYAIKLFEMIKDPAHIAEFNQMYSRIEAFMLEHVTDQSL